MQGLADELRNQTDLNVAILGINYATSSYPQPGSTPPAGMVAGRTLPWLRPLSASSDPRSTWQVPLLEPGRPSVFYRDAIILDRNNEFFAVQNFTSEPISGESGAAARQKFRDLLIAAATHRDLDNDHLPDDWEEIRFGSRAVQPGDRVANGLTALETFILSQPATHQLAQQSLDVEILTAEAGGGRHLAAEFPLRIGRSGGWQTVLQVSDDFLQWRETLPGELVVGPVTFPYDGFGTWRVKVRTAKTLEEGAPRAMRLKFQRTP